MNHGPGLTFRFLGAQVLVVAISLAVAAAVASLVGPSLFHDRLLMAGLEDPSLEPVHAGQAYREAHLTTLAGALPTARPCALLARAGLPRRRAGPRRTGLPGRQPHHPGRRTTGRRALCRARQPVAVAPTAGSPAGSGPGGHEHGGGQLPPQGPGR